tara:strand:- start:166 stop:975 length:810 start_codon:yes stop_codon:yes gene_type:complete
MPEGPEVKTTVDFLKKYQNKSLTHFQVVSGRYTKKPIHNINNPGWCTPLNLESVNCKGKFIYFSFEKNVHFFSTLGMTGEWSNRLTRHTRLKFEFDSNKDEPLYFNDVRNFGTLKIILSNKDLDKKLKSLGPDILSSYVDAELFKSRLDKKPNWSVAKALMDQSVVSGVGNYLKAEILYASEISPHRLCKDLTTKEVELIAQESFDITRLSYNSGGATIKNYRKPDGKKGLYSQRFAVYNQKTSPCGHEVIKEQTLDKRTTHWVPAVQK